MARVYVTVIGSSAATRWEEEAAYRVGYLLARRGAVVVTGGRGGVMEAASRGAKDGGGLTLGILPGVSRDANPYVDIAVPTGLGHARNAVNVLAGDAVIAVGGGPGTLSEIGLALAYGRPVVALRGPGAAGMLAGRSVGGRQVYGVGSPEEAVEEALRLAGAGIR